MLSEQSSSIHDTYRIALVQRLSTHTVSDAWRAPPYYRRMPYRDVWKGWPARFKAHYRKHHMRASDVAEKLAITEAALRHRLNGTRQVDLAEFFAMCAAVEANPLEILFGGLPLSDEQMASLGQAMHSLLWHRDVEPPKPRPKK